MNMWYKLLKKELALQLSKIYPIIIKKGISNDMKLYGNLFYNHRRDELYEEENLYIYLDLKDKIIIDVGADIGIYSLFFATAVGGNGKVFSFEPNPLNFYFLMKNINANNLKNIHPINLGLSNKLDTLYFISRRYNRAKGTFKLEKEQDLKVPHDRLIKVEIPVTTLDESVDKYTIKHVDFVKIDTEGYEPYVIEGMTKTLKKLKPVIYFEVHGKNVMQKQTDLKRILNFISPFGYNIFQVNKGLQHVSDSNISKFNGGGYLAFGEINGMIKKVLDRMKA